MSASISFSIPQIVLRLLTSWSSSLTERIGPLLGGEEYLSSAGDSWRIGEDGLSGEVDLLGGGELALGEGLDGLKLPPLVG